MGTDRRIQLSTLLCFLLFFGLLFLGWTCVRGNLAIMRELHPADQGPALAAIEPAE